MPKTPEEIFQGHYLSTEQLMCQNIPFSQIGKWLSSGRIEKIDRGVYCLPNTQRDDLALLQYRYDKCIFSGITALSLHGLTDHISEYYHVSFPQGYNPSSLRDCPWNISVTRSIPKIYGLGIMKMRTKTGNEISVYDRERSLCDILRGKGLPPFIVRTAMKRYFNSSDKDVSKLKEYAQLLHVSDRIDRFIELY